VNLGPSRTLKEGAIIRTNIREYSPYVIRNGNQTQQMPPLERPIVFIQGNP
jgi:hypothetical protein